ncbi:MAG: AEC family transporter, partial [Lachnospiraceae bacterium]|nr:AEC family transporter [Lachnospiraceae bacterium]
DRPTVSILVTVFVASVLLYTIIPIISYMIVVITKTPKKLQGVYTFMYTYSNVGFMGFPILNAVFGPTAVFYAGIVNILFNFTCYSYGIVMINKWTDTKAKVNWKTLVSPGMLCSVFAIVIFALDIKFPAPVTDTISTMGDITPTLAMLLIGSTLATIDIKDVFNDARVYVFSVIKQIILPLLCVPLCKLFIKDELVYGVILIMLLMPVANTAVLFTTNYEHDEKLAAKCVFITTFMSLFTIPIMMMIFFK